MPYASELAVLAGVLLLACISPGPDFVAVTSNALISRARGLAVAVGTTAACSVWALLAMFGFGILLTQVAWLYEAIRFIGAAYLLYLGAKMLLSARRPYDALQVSKVQSRERSPFLVGFMVGMTNPKAAAFFGSLFITILPLSVPALVQGAAVMIVALVVFSWFSLLAVMFSTARVRSVYTTLRRPIDALMGIILVGLGLRLAVSR